MSPWFVAILSNRYCAAETCSGIQFIQVTHVYTTTYQMIVQPLQLLAAYFYYHYSVTVASVSLRALFSDT